MSDKTAMEAALARLNAGEFNLWGGTDLHVLQAMRRLGIAVSPAFQSVIVLCGSTRFRQQYEHVQKLLSLAGHVPLSVEFYHHDDGVQLSGRSKRRLDSLHRRKIDLADGIFVLNANGYIGESTMNEIIHATALRKPIGWFEPHNAITVTTSVDGPDADADLRGTTWTIREHQRA